ncbi:TMV resistance protein N-like [Neltuma alba]|uniref:TMV resistance protein N-like n=1 Tax=Neltuma alba TaxID=207710 RepID=UPI0010A34585|nr:TMV resistance protein N-like [Prosopis alba]
MQNLIRELKEVGGTLFDEQQIQAVMRSLPASWDTMKHTITHNESIKTFADVARHLQLEDDRMETVKPINSGATDHVSKDHGNFTEFRRIIITNRDEKILDRHGVDKVYKIELLNGEEAAQHLSRRAFRSDDPNNEFEELSHRLLQYAKALPLAIKVSGSSLFKLQQSEWEAQVDRLKENPNQEED